MAARCPCVTVSQHSTVNMNVLHIQIGLLHIQPLIKVKVIYNWSNPLVGLSVLAIKPKTYQTQPCKNGCEHIVGGTHQLVKIYSCFHTSIYLQGGTQCVLNISQLCLLFTTGNADYNAVLVSGGVRVMGQFDRYLEMFTMLSYPHISQLSILLTLHLPHLVFLSDFSVPQVIFLSDWWFLPSFFSSIFPSTVHLCVLSLFIFLTFSSSLLALVITLSCNRLWNYTELCVCVCVLYMWHWWWRGCLCF